MRPIEKKTKEGAVLAMRDKTSSLPALDSSSAHAGLASMVLMVSAFLLALDVTITGPMSPSVASDLHASFWAQQGFASGYSMPFTAAILSALVIQRDRAWWSDLKWGWLILGTGAFLSAVSGNGWSFVTGRIAQGLGGGTMLLAVMALSTTAFSSPRQTSWAVSLLSSAIGLGMLMGAVLGGMITAWSSWRLCFAVQASIAALCALLISQRRLFPQAYPGSGNATSPGTQSLWRVLSTAPQCKRFVGVQIVSICIGVCFWSLMYHFPIYLQSTEGFLPADSSYVMLSLTAPLVLAPPVGGMLAQRFSPRFPLVIGMGLALTGLLCAIVTSFYHQQAELIACMSLSAVGAGLMNGELNRQSAQSVDSMQAQGAVFNTALRHAAFTFGSLFLGAVMYAFNRSYSRQGWIAVLITCSLAAGIGLLACSWARD